MPPAPVNITGTDTVGKAVGFPSQAYDASVIIITSTECPIANRLAPAIESISRYCAKNRVLLLMAFLDADATDKSIEDHKKEYKLTAIAVHSVSVNLARALNATVTPEAAILDKNGLIVYRGCINDKYLNGGKVKAKATNEYLQKALTEHLAGKRIEYPLTPAFGCDIP